MNLRGQPPWRLLGGRGPRDANLVMRLAIITIITILCNMCVYIYIYIYIYMYVYIDIIHMSVVRGAGRGGRLEGDPRMRSALVTSTLQRELE